MTFPKALKVNSNSVSDTICNVKYFKNDDASSSALLWWPLLPVVMIC